MIANEADKKLPSPSSEKRRGEKGGHKFPKAKSG
jgi:hypothetical protein